MSVLYLSVYVVGALWSISIRIFFSSNVVIYMRSLSRLARMFANAKTVCASLLEAAIYCAGGVREAAPNPISVRAKCLFRLQKLNGCPALCRFASMYCTYIPDQAELRQ